MSSFISRLHVEKVKFDMQQVYDCCAILNTEDLNQLKESIKTTFNDSIIEPQLSGIVLSEQELPDVKNKISDILVKYLIIDPARSKALPQTVKDQLKCVLKVYLLHLSKELGHPIPGAAPVTINEVEPPLAEK